LVLVHTPAPYDGYPDAPWNGARLAMEGAYLDGKADELAREYGITVVPEHVKGAVVPTIVELVQRHKPDLIVMTTHGRTGVSRAWLGSVADTVMRSVDVPVLMLRAAEANASPTKSLAFRRVMIPLDGSARAERIVDAALTVAGSDATYVLARAVPPVPLVTNFVDPYAVVPIIPDPDATERSAVEAKEYLLKVAHDLNENAAPAVEEAVAVSEYTAPTLLAAAKTHNVDLIALATHGRGASRFVFGSVADKILRGSTLPILVCRGGTA
jgi:nucleotide-binding universal stress UspA family protein